MLRIGKCGTESTLPAWFSRQTKFDIIDFRCYATYLRNAAELSGGGTKAEQGPTLETLPGGIKPYDVI